MLTRGLRCVQVWAAPLFISPGDSRDAPVLPHVLSALRAKMLPLSQGLEYLQDYLSIASLTMWQQVCAYCITALPVQVNLLISDVDVLDVSDIQYIDIRYVLDC